MTAPALNFIVTNVGRAAIVNATSTGTDPVLISEIGLSATNAAGTVASTALAGEFKRVDTIGGVITSPDTIHVDMLDESGDNYTVRSIGIYLSDGTLFAIYSQAGALFEKSTQAQLAFAWDCMFADISAATLSFPAANFLAPLATTEIEGLVELATDAEAAAGIDPARVVTPKSLAPLLAAAALLTKILTVDGAGSGLDADTIHGLQATALAKLAGAIFTGPIGRDANFLLDIVGGNAELKLDAGGDALRWKRGSNALALAIAGAERFIFDGAGARFDGNTIWHAANDGPGSGLDADLLDGLESTAFLRRINDVWQTSAEGIQRFYFGNNGITFIGAGPGGWAFQYNTVNRTTIDTAGNLATAGYVSAIGGMYTQGGTVWHSANDGAGSGLDADLFDGLDSSAFLKVAGGFMNGPISYDTATGEKHLRFVRPGALAYYYGTTGNVGLHDTVWGQAYNFDLNTGAFTIRGSLAWHSGNDGSGSGLDADLLDGYQGSAFALRGGDVAFRDIFANRGDGTGLVSFPSGRYVHFDGVNYHMPSSWLYVNGGFVWNSANDGAGSGLDADLVDGWQRDDIRSWNNLINVQGGTAGADYLRFPNGMILQWGSFVANANGFTGPSFPIAFPNACFACPISGVGEAGAGSQDNAPAVYGMPTQYGFTVFSADDVAATCTFIAIGC